MASPETASEKEGATNSEAGEEDYERMESVPVEDTPEEDDSANIKEQSESAAATDVAPDSASDPKETEDTKASAVNQEPQDQQKEEEESPKIELLDTSSYTPDEPQDLKHNLQPGDHVIRWEMTVIAWPIQIHGIVLEVGRQYVELADFGLTAQPQKEGANNTEEEEDKNKNDKQDETTSTTTTTTTNSSETPSHHHVHQQAPFMDHPVAQKMEDAVSSAWNKLRKEKKRPKQRITVHIITTQKDLNRWHKINYGSKLFGLGGDENGGGMEGMDEDGSDPQASKKTSLAHKFKNSLKFGKGRQQQPSQQEGDESGSSPNSPTKKFHRIRAASAKMNTSMQNIKNDPRVKNVNEKTAQGFSRFASLWTPKKQQPPDEIHSNSASLDDPDTSISTEEQLQQQQQLLQQQQDETNATTVEQDDSMLPASELSKRHMNPAMAKILADRALEKEQQQQSKDNKDSTAAATAQKPPPKNKLPKSDPPKLVLARAYFLLKHGESVLPPYHAFHSNSECIAVFCKTGVWSTLQAAVFLHSTAIGNAKSTMAVTLGVAASVPVLAPVIGGIGLAMVGAPWLILKESKGKWEEATNRLTDLFWAQAEPEVFVECIEHWSGLVPRPGASQQHNKSISIVESNSQGSLASTSNLSSSNKVESKDDDGDVDTTLEQEQTNGNGVSNENGMEDTNEGSDEKTVEATNGEESASAEPAPAHNYRLASV